MKLNPPLIKRLIIIFVLFGVCCGFCLLLTTGYQFHQNALATFGNPDPRLSLWQQFSYEIYLMTYKDELLSSHSTNTDPVEFTIHPEEPVSDILNDLQKQNLIESTTPLQIYLQYSGRDKNLLAGHHSIPPHLSPIQIAQALTSSDNLLVPFTILPGWRIEEIAQALIASGLRHEPEDFIGAANQPLQKLLPNFSPQDSVTTEGFLLPDRYTIFPRLSDEDLIRLFVQNFQKQLTPDIVSGIENQGLSVYQAVILASILQRETTNADEMPLIASVYLNRLHANMKLDADPTVQYALGYNSIQKTWWTNPLRTQDFQIDSPYNTYLYPGLPPSPICNPGIAAIKAVAFPAATDLYYFRVACDKSGRHVFSKTYEEHLNQACP